MTWTNLGESLKSGAIFFCGAFFFAYTVKILICSETTLTGESWFHISPLRGFEPVTLVAGSKQVSPLDQ